MAEEVKVVSVRELRKEKLRAVAEDLNGRPALKPKHVIQAHVVGDQLIVRIVPQPPF